MADLSARVLPGLGSAPGAPGEPEELDPAARAEAEDAARRAAALAALEDLSEDEIAERLAAQIEAMSDGD